MESPLLLTIIGVFASCCVLLVDYAIATGLEFRRELAEKSLGWLLIYSVLMASFAAIVVSLISPKAAGSGLPEMKVAISGVVMAEYLSWRCFLAKFVGIILASAAGLSIGKEGPFIMITCCFTHLLMQVQSFHRIKEDSSKYLEMLACACAAAVSATFGTPFGGVLFSVEVTSTFYMVRNLPRSFFAAIVGTVMITVLGHWLGHAGFDEASLGIGRLTEGLPPKHGVAPFDILLFGVVGVLCGLLGAAFVAGISQLVTLRNLFLDSAQPYGKGRWWQTPVARSASVVAIGTTFAVCIEYFGASTWFFQRGSQGSVLELLFSPPRDSEYTSESIYQHLQVFFPLKLLVTAFCVVLPVPAGIFAPTFLIGGLLGRLIGEFCALYFTGMTLYRPYEFAVIAAAAFCSGVTRAISTAVIVLELGNSTDFSIPVSVAILAAYFTGGRFTENVYDVLITTNHLPRLKKLPKAAYDIPTWEVMVSVDKMALLTADSTYREASALLNVSLEPVFPIVDDEQHMLFLGSVSRARLEAAVRYCIEREGGETKRVKPAIATRRFSITDMLIEGSDGADHRERSRSSHEYHGGKSTGTPTLHLLDWPIQFAYMQGGKCIRWVRVQGAHLRSKKD